MTVPDLRRPVSYQDSARSSKAGAASHAAFACCLAAMAAFMSKPPALPSAVIPLKKKAPMGYQSHPQYGLLPKGHGEVCGNLRRPNSNGQTHKQTDKQTNRHTDKLDHGWPESITSQARSAQRCRMRSFSLHEAFLKQARDSTGQGALRKLVGASWSAQVALRKLHCASCSAQVAPRKLLRASWSLQVAPCKLLCANCSVQVAPCKLLCASCSVQVALCKLLCVSCSAQVALGKALRANWSVQVGLRKLLCASCILRRPPADQGGIERATRRSREQARKPRDNSRGQLEQQKSQKTLSFCTSTTPIPAEGRAGMSKNAKKTPRSPQRVARAC